MSHRNTVLARRPAHAILRFEENNVLVHIMVSLLRPAAFVSLSFALKSSSRRSLIGRAASGLLLCSATRAQTCRAATTANSGMDSSHLGYLDAQSAARLDQELMSSPGFSLEQLMELAGLSVAEAVYQVLQETKPAERPHVLIVCGPGNNGGDGLVAARHLVMFGYDATVLYPKQSKQQHFINLVQQCQDVGISIHASLSELDRTMEQYACVVDAIFGFSFKGEPRDPFKGILEQLKGIENPLTIAVDVPSGWNVDEGDVSGIGFEPDVLVSLTAPKLSAKFFKGRHFVGGRFLPPKLAEKYQISMPDYPDVAQVVEVVDEKATGI